MTKPDMTRISRAAAKDFLDLLAALVANSRVGLDTDASGEIALRPLPDPKASVGGYVARRGGAGKLWWINLGEAGIRSDRWPVGSVDITKLTGHQRIELAAAFNRVREILRGGEA